MFLQCDYVYLLVQLLHLSQWRPYIWKKKTGLSHYQTCGVFLVLNNMSNNLWQYQSYCPFKMSMNNVMPHGKLCFWKYTWCKSFDGSKHGSFWNLPLWIDSFQINFSDFPFKVIYYWCNKIKQIKNVIFSYGIIFEQKIFLLKERPREKFDVN